MIFDFAGDFKSIPFGTDYGSGEDRELNQKIENEKITYLENELYNLLKTAVNKKQRPIFTTALIAGDAVILDALAKMDLLKKTPVVFVDTFTLFPESLAHLREVEAHYGFKSLVYHAAGCKDQNDYHEKYGRDYWMKDIDQYDMLCKVYSCNWLHGVSVNPFSVSFVRWSR